MWQLPFIKSTNGWLRVVAIHFLWLNYTLDWLKYGCKGQVAFQSYENIALYFFGVLFCINICYSRYNKIWWLCLVPTSTTRFASEVGYRIAKIWHGYTRKIFFMNNDIKFLNRERRTRYSLTHFEDHFWIACLSYFLDPNMYGFQFIWRVLLSQIPVVNWQN